MMDTTRVPKKLHFQNTKAHHAHDHTVPNACARGGCELFVYHGPFWRHVKSRLWLGKSVSMFGEILGLSGEIRYDFGEIVIFQVHGCVGKMDIMREIIRTEKRFYITK